jgi:dolichol-phosphate mannosyltransferase
LREALKELTGKLSGKGYDYEIVLVDDGSSDSTWPRIVLWASESPERVRGVSLSRNFGHQAALSCAYRIAAGDVMVSLDADLQDPPEVVLEMLERHEAGADIVLGVRRSREAESAFKLITAKLYYRTLHLLGMKFVEKDCGDFRLMNRRAVDALNAMDEKNRLLRAMVCWSGFKVDRVLFDRKARAAGTTKYPLRKMLLLAMDGLISFTSVPLRLAYWFSFLISAGIFAYLAWTFVKYWFFNGQLVHGWTSLMLAIAAFGSVNLLCLGLIGEYVGRIYDEVKGRPLYFIKSDTREASARHSS